MSHLDNTPQIGQDTDKRDEDIEMEFNFNPTWIGCEYTDSVPFVARPVGLVHGTATVGYSSMALRKFSGQCATIAPDYLFTCGCGWSTSRESGFYQCLIYHAFMECSLLLRSLQDRLMPLLAGLPVKLKIQWRNLKKPPAAKNGFAIVMAQLLYEFQRGRFNKPEKKRFSPRAYLEKYGYVSGPLRLGGLVECLPVPSQIWQKFRYGVGGDAYSSGARISMTTLSNVTIARIPFIRGEVVFPPRIAEVKYRHHYYSRVYWERLFFELRLSQVIPRCWKAVHKISDPDFFPLPHRSHPPYEI